MTQTPSPCPPSDKGKWRAGMIFVAAFISLSIVGLWIFSIRHSSAVVAYLGAGYALLCTAFLAAQMIAFVKAHMDYDKTIEQPKYDLLKMEEAEWIAYADGSQ